MAGTLVGSLSEESEEASSVASAREGTAERCGAEAALFGGAFLFLLPIVFSFCSPLGWVLLQFLPFLFISFSHDLGVHFAELSCSLVDPFSIGSVVLLPVQLFLQCLLTDFRLFRLL